MRAARMIVAVVIAGAAAFASVGCKGGGGGGGVEVVAGAPAGDVTEAAGVVSATRDGKTRALATGDVVSGDDVVKTGDDGRVTIVLRHNQVPWSLGPNKEKRVADSAAWAAAKGASGEAVSDDRSTAAGRHAERSATDTGASAPAPAAATTTPTAPAAPAVDEKPPSLEPAAAAAKDEPAPDKAEERGPPPAEKKAPSRDDLAGDSAGDQGVAPALRGGGGGPGGGAPAGGALRGSPGGDVGGVGGAGRVEPDGPRARVALGAVSSDGGLDNDAANRVVRARLGLFKACYQRALRQNPSLIGMLELRIAVKKDGTVATSKVTGPDDLAETRACIQSQIGHLQFPSSKAESTVTAKMMLSPDG